MSRIGVLVSETACFGDASSIVQSVHEAHIEKSHVDGRTKKCPANPWPGMEFTPKPSVSDFPERCEWGFGNDRAEARLLCERLQQLCCPHRLSQACLLYTSPSPRDRT